MTEKQLSIQFQQFDKCHSNIEKVLADQAKAILQEVFELNFKDCDHLINEFNQYYASIIANRNEHEAKKRAQDDT